MSLADQGLDPNRYTYGGSFTSVAGLTDRASADDLQNYGDKFSQLFENYVGRKPTDNEVTQFYQQVVAPQGSFPGGNYPGSQELRDRTTNFISDTYQNAAQDVAQQKLEAQQGKANDLANLFRTQGQSSINDVQKSLQDYQASLFERLRPNLITSLQAQGLLNTGALNTAVAGAQKDLADSGSQYIADLTYQNNQGANQIAFSGASAPYQFQQNQILNSVPNMQNAGAGALQNSYNSRMNDLNFLNQIALQNNAARNQSSMQPSFLRTLGQGFAGSLGSSAGNSFGQWFSPGAGQGSSSGGGNYAKLFA